MKTEKTMKVKKITLVSLIVAIVASAITLMSVFLPKHKIAQAATDKDAKNTQAEQTISQIESLEAEYQKSFDEHATLWEKYFAELQKLDELPNDFDEKAFIGGLTTLTEDEKETLLKNVDALDELDAKLDKLYGELFDKDEDILYNDCEDGACDFAERDDKYFADGECGDGECGDGDLVFIEDDENYFGDNFEKACDEAEQTNDMIQSLRKEFDEVMDAHAELWDKVFASYDELDENFDYANFDEGKYISELAVLTAEEKETLLKDLAKLDEIASKISELCGANCGK